MMRFGTYTAGSDSAWIYRRSVRLLSAGYTAGRYFFHLYGPKNRFHQMFQNILKARRMNSEMTNDYRQHN